MIVLSLMHKGRTHEVRTDEPRVVLGTKANADVRYAEAGWGAVEATLFHEGTRVRLERADGSVQRLRVGDEVRIGSARIRLVGLLPLPPAPVEAPPSPTFGSYDDELRLAGVEVPAPPAPPKTFELEGESAAAAAPPPPAPPPPKPTAAAPPDATPPGSAPSNTTKPEATKAGALRSVRAHPPAFGNTSFGEELVLQLKRAPYFTVSLAAHILAVLILGLIQADAEQSREALERLKLIATTLEFEEQELRGELDNPFDEGAPLVDPDDPLFPELEAPDPVVEREKEAEAPLSLEPLVQDGGTIMPIGLNPSILAVNEKDRSRRPIPTMDLERRFGAGEEGSVNQRSADYVRARMGRGRGNRGNPFSSLVRADLLVAKAGWDDIGRVLSSLRLPYVSIPMNSLAHDRAPDLSQRKVIFLNCGEALSESRRLIAEKRIRAFVKKGGYLFTTDWSIRNIVRGAFPEYLDTTSGGGNATFPESVVPIGPAPGAASHPLLRGVFLPGVQAQWWLERASYDIEILDRRRVTSLIVSPVLRTRFGKSPVVAATFRYGRGRVLHIAGHYFQKMGNLAGTIAAHRIALNFVMERLARDRRTRR